MPKKPPERRHQTLAPVRIVRSGWILCVDFVVCGQNDHSAHDFFQYNMNAVQNAMLECAVFRELYQKIRIVAANPCVENGIRL